MAKKQTTTAKIRAFILENPKISSSFIAEKFGVKSTYVSTIKWKLKQTPKKNVEKAQKPLIMEYTPPLEVTKPYVSFVHAADPVNNPSHYKDGGIETIDYIEAKRLGYHLGNAVKYISRAGKKGTNQGLEDLKKAQWYLNRAIEKNEFDPAIR